MKKETIRGGGFSAVVGKESSAIAALNSSAPSKDF